MMNRYEEINYREALDYAEAYFDIAHKARIGSARMHTFTPLSSWRKLDCCDAYRHIQLRDDDAVFIECCSHYERVESLEIAESKLRADGWITYNEYVSKMHEIKSNI